MKIFLPFQTRHPRITLGVALQDVFREALYRFCKHSVPLGVAGDFGFHPYRNEDDNRYHLRLSGQAKGS